MASESQFMIPGQIALLEQAESGEKGSTDGAVRDFNKCFCISNWKVVTITVLDQIREP